VGTDVGYTHQQSGRSKVRNAHTGGLLCGHERWIHTSTIRQEQGKECTHKQTSVWTGTLDTHISNQAGAR